MRLLLLFFIFSFLISAKELARPDSIGGDYIVEFVYGVVYEDDENVLEYGVDLEHFLPESNHHFSIGVSLELENTKHGNLYFVGPLFSAYFMHYKFFLSSGVLTDFDHSSILKNRIGVGYEFTTYDEWLIVPTIAIDHFDNRTYGALSIGLAHEF